MPEQIVKWPISHEHEHEVGQQLWFEYHCWEDDRSSDAEVWYRSHQMCEILSQTDCDGVGIWSQAERYESGHQLLYRVRFQDGLEWDVFEDELLQSRDGFTRPDPPTRKIK